MDLVDPRGAATMRRFMVPGERMVVVHRPHAMSLFGTVFALFVGFILTIAIGFTAPASLGALTNATWYVLAAMTAYTLIVLWLWSRDWFMATNQRLVWRRGVFNRKTAMMPLSKVTDMSFNQPLIGRFLGYGEFIMESAGQEQALRDIRWIPHPEKAYRAICAELFAGEEPVIPPMVPVAAGETRIDDTDPNLPRGVEPAAVPEMASHAIDEEALSRLGSYVDRYRTQARTPLRERLLRGPQPTEPTPDHRMGTELQDVGDEDGAWAVSREDSTKVVWVERDKRP
ncbi:PH domain-containing protein [Calidifontibacter terrae]